MADHMQFVWKTKSTHCDTYSIHSEMLRPAKPIVLSDVVNCNSIMKGHVGCSYAFNYIMQEAANKRGGKRTLGGGGGRGVRRKVSRE